MSFCMRIVPGLVGAALLVPGFAAEAQELGRLFFSPERRALLERQRTQNVEEARTLQGTTMSLDGVVYRSSGKATVWINKQAQTENESSRTGVSAQISRKSPGSAVLTPGEDIPTQIKVGETVNRATGERNTRLGDGVVVTPASPAARR